MLVSLAGLLALVLAPEPAAPPDVLLWVAPATPPAPLMVVVVGAGLPLMKRGLSLSLGMVIPWLN
jgi:hypothetical protein